MDIGGNNTQGAESRLNESIILREIVNEIGKRAMQEWMERMERQIETLEPFYMS